MLCVGQIFVEDALRGSFSMIVIRKLLAYVASDLLYFVNEYIYTCCSQTYMDCMVICIRN